MANYSIVINSRFKPFSYQELLHPVMTATQAQQQVEEAYANMALEAELAGGRINEQVDKEAYKTYKAYSDELSRLSERLARNGLTPEDRRTMYGMRARYAKEISPIETAYERRRALAEEQRKMQLTANGNLRFDNDFSTMSLDKLISNPELSYNALNGENITARASAMAANFARGIVSDPKYSSILNGQYWQTMQRQGYTPEQIIMEAAGDPNAPAELRNIREAIHKQLSSNTAYDRDWVDTYISQGFTSGIGQAQYSTMGDQSYLNAAQRQAMQISAENQRWAREDRQPIRIESDESGNERWIDPVKGMVYHNSAPDSNGKRHRIYETGVGTNSKNGSSNSSSSSNSSGSSTSSNNVRRLTHPMKISIQGTHKKGAKHNVIKPYDPFKTQPKPSVSFNNVASMNEDLNSEGSMGVYTVSYYGLPNAIQQYVQNSIGNEDVAGNLYHIKQYEDGTVDVYIEPGINVKALDEYTSNDTNMDIH